MTAIDLGVIAGLVVVVYLFLRHRSFRIGRGAQSLPSIFGLLGLSLTGLVHVGDLLGMYVLPAFYGEASRQLWQMRLHTELDLVIRLAALLLLATAVLLSSSNQKLSSKALRISEDRYRSIVENQRDLIVRWQLNGKCTWVPGGKSVMN